MSRKEPIKLHRKTLAEVYQNAASALMLLPEESPGTTSPPTSTPPSAQPPVPTSGGPLSKLKTPRSTKTQTRRYI